MIVRGLNGAVGCSMYQPRQLALPGQPARPGQLDRREIKAVAEIEVQVRCGLVETRRELAHIGTVGVGGALGLELLVPGAPEGVDEIRFTAQASHLGSNAVGGEQLLCEMLQIVRQIHGVKRQLVGAASR